MKKGIISSIVFARSLKKGALQLVTASDTLVPEKPWSYIKNLKPSPGRFFHVSQEYKREKFVSPDGVEHEYWAPHFTDGSGRARGRTFYYPKSVLDPTAIHSNEGVTL